MKKSTSLRWVYLALGVVALLFGGIIYGWSILKTPLSETFGWSVSELALNYTLTMCFFCVGCFVGGTMSRKFGVRPALVLAAVLGFVGFFMASRMTGDIIILFISYGILASTGIGIAYNVIISAVSAWFPDKKATCSGVLMMGFGLSSLLIGNIASRIIDGPGWRIAYMALGIALGLAIAVSAGVLRLPGADDVLPEAKAKAEAASEDFEVKDLSTVEMIRRPSFWKGFFCIVFLAAVGNTVISFTKDFALSVGATASLATSLVGVLSLSNGLGRVALGAIFDKLGRRKAMLLANIVAIIAMIIMLISVSAGSVALAAVGLIVTGLSYGAAATIVPSFTSAFYGTKYFSTNFSVMTFNLVPASFMATVAGSFLESTGGYTLPLMLLLGLAVISLVLDLVIKRP